MPKPSRVFKEAAKKAIKKTKAEPKGTPFSAPKRAKQIKERKQMIDKMWKGM